MNQSINADSAWMGFKATRVHIQGKLDKRSLGWIRWHIQKKDLKIGPQSEAGDPQNSGQWDK